MASRVCTTEASSWPMRRSTISLMPAATSKRHSEPSLTMGIGRVQPDLPTSIIALLSPDVTTFWPSSHALRKASRRRLTSSSVPRTHSRQSPPHIPAIAGRCPLRGGAAIGGRFPIGRRLAVGRPLALKLAAELLTLVGAGPGLVVAFALGRGAIRHAVTVRGIVLPLAVGVPVGVEIVGAY